MIKIELKEFQDCVSCQSNLYSSRESFLKVNHLFNGGKVYGFASDFGCGSWGLATCLGGRSENPDGEVLLNGKTIHCNELSKFSCFISESIFPEINSIDDYLTPKLCIEKALSISKLNYTVEEIRNMFCLSGYNERFERDLRYVSGEIWAISTAIGFALGKEIFCYPWLNEREIIRAHKPHIELLKKHNRIILIPSSKKKQLKKICDNLLIFENGKIITK